VDAEQWGALVEQWQAGADSTLYPPTDPRGHRAMTEVPAQQCAGKAEHGMHEWNIYDPDGSKLRRVNPEGLRICLGHTNPTLAAVRESMAVYFKPHLPVTRDRATTQVVVRPKQAE
jgi:hypothetical protein